MEEEKNEYFLIGDIVGRKDALGFKIGAFVITKVNHDTKKYLLRSLKDNSEGYLDFVNKDKMYVVTQEYSAKFNRRKLCIGKPLMLETTYPNQDKMECGK